MKIIFCMLAVLFCVTFCSAQRLGIGMGTAGINLKSGSIKHFKLVGRINPLFTNRFISNTIINGSVVASYVLLKETAGLMYLGAGVGTARTEYARIIAEAKWYVNWPVGMELFPFSTKRVSLTAEMGPYLDVDGADGVRRFSFKGLLEFSYYLGKSR